MNEVVHKTISEATTSAVRLIGTVKWFDTAKGYGFVVPESVEGCCFDQDVMLHISCLREFGESNADEGARIICDMVQRPRGWQVVNIIEMDRSQAALIKSLGDATVYRRAVVKWFNAAQGFGFVNLRDDPTDIFIHISVLKKAGYETLDTGMELDVITGQSNKGQNVVMVRQP